MSVSVALVCLALLDGLLVGFRAAAGRDGRVDKGRYHARAMAIGVAASGAAAAVCVAVAGALVVASPGVFPDLVAAGRRLLLVYVPYAAVALAALALWATPVAEVRTIASVSVLGPFTMLRPLVVVAGLALGVAARPRAEVVALALVVGAVALSMERVLGRLCFPVDRALYDAARGRGG